MHYPDYHEQGWPIGSGMVESANKHVVLSRLKGAGMHWEPCHVNPMLALHGAQCNERWEEAWQQCSKHRRSQRMQQRLERYWRRYEQMVRVVQCSLLLLRLRTRPPKPSKSTCSTSPAQPAGPRRPAADHPWRRRLLAKK
jgi:hypothetical protein